MRRFVFALALAVSLPLAACDSADPAPAATADSRTIGVSCPDCRHQEPRGPEDCSGKSVYVCVKKKGGGETCACILD